MIEKGQKERSSASGDEKEDIQRSDLFNNLLAASEEESSSGGAALSRRELMGASVFQPEKVMSWPSTDIISISSSRKYLRLSSSRT